MHTCTHAHTLTGLAQFMSRIALPSVVFSAMMTIEFSTLNWNLVLGLALSRTAVFGVTVLSSMAANRGNPLATAKAGTVCYIYIYMCVCVSVPVCACASVCLCLCACVCVPVPLCPCLCLCARSSPSPSLSLSLSLFLSLSLSFSLSRYCILHLCITLLPPCVPQRHCTSALPFGLSTLPISK